jgi:hypothetical protein
MCTGASLGGRLERFIDGRCIEPVWRGASMVIGVRPFQGAGCAYLEKGAPASWGAYGQARTAIRIERARGLTDTEVWDG